MSKYNINECFNIISRLTAPVNTPMAKIAGIALSNVNDILNKIDGINNFTYKLDVNDGEILIHVIKPQNNMDKMPCILDIHGGGFIFDGAPHMYEYAANYALKTNSVVIFPRYRLTPKHNYPKQLNDCFMTYDWIKENSDMLNIDVNKIGILGDSAGGYLAAMTVNYAASIGDKLLFQLLIYPVTDPLMSTESMKRFIDTPVWNAKNNKSMWNLYFRKQEIDRASQSLLIMDLPTNIPDTYIETAEFDCLHDEAILYANRLIKSNVNVFINETKETMHGFDEVKCQITDNAVNNRIEFLNKCISIR